MCLIVFAWRQHARWDLVLGANRDEFYARPTAPAARWPDAPQVIAGRDLQAGGTWMGITDGGRFAAVTNLRDPALAASRARSRGALVADFLRGDEPAMRYAARIAAVIDEYAGFNLLVGDGDALVYLATRDPMPRALAPGLYGISNATLDTPWPKLARAKHQLAQALPKDDPEADVLALLADRTIADDAALPSTGISLALERALSPAFIATPGYGTRASSLVVQRGGAHRFVECAYGEQGQPLGVARFAR